MINTELSGGDAVLRVAVLEQQVAALKAEKAGRQQAVPRGYIQGLISAKKAFVDQGFSQIDRAGFGIEVYTAMDELRKGFFDKLDSLAAAALVGIMPSAPAAPDVAGLVEALKGLMEVRVIRADHTYGLAYYKAEKALATFHREG